MKTRDVNFTTIDTHGKVLESRTLTNREILACPHIIMVASHYRDDNSCKCDDAAERARMIKEWEYKASDFKDIPLRS